VATRRRIAHVQTPNEPSLSFLHLGLKLDLGELVLIGDELKSADGTNDTVPVQSTCWPTSLVPTTFNSPMTRFCHRGDGDAAGTVASTSPSVKNAGLSAVILSIVTLIVARFR
jgi:hypothetical protein